MTQYIKGSKGNNKKDHVIVRQYDDASEVIRTEPMTFKQAIDGMMYFENKGYKLLDIEKVTQ
jgi:hypothetical protein